MTQNGVNTTWQETPAGRQMLSVFSEERTLHAVEHLLARLDTLERAVEDLTLLMRQGPGLLAMATDAADEIFSNSDKDGASLETRIRNGLEMAGKLTAPGIPEKLDQLLAVSENLPGLVAMAADSADEMMKNAVAHGFDPQALIAVAGAANRALTAAAAEPPAPPGGIFALLRALKDPDRQRGIGFLLNFLRHFGKNI